MNDTLEAILRRHAGRPVLIDTNVLLLLIIGSYDQRLIARFNRTADFTGEDFDLLRLSLEQTRGVVVTPHVLTEVSNFLGHLWEPVRTDLFETTLRALVLAAEERTIPAVELAGDELFPRVGLTDVGIRRSAGDVLILTDDLRLSNFLYEAGADFVNFRHLQSGAC